LSEEGRERGSGPQVRRSGGSAPSGGAGAELPLGVKLKTKNGLDASRKAFGDVQCQLYCPYLISA